MKKINLPIIILLIVAVASLGFGISSTTKAVEAGQDYKEGMRSYNQFADAEGTIIGDYAAKLAAQAFAASKTAEVIKKELYKYFSISLLLYLVAAGSILLAYMQYDKLKQKENE